MQLILNIFFKQRRAFYALLCFIVTSNLKSQVVPNLVNNYSFEDTVRCPNPLIWPYINDSKYWFSSIPSSPDYFNSCVTGSILSTPSNSFGNQVPRTGKAYAGLGTYALGSEYREYIGNGLKATLKTNKNYCVSYYVSYAETFMYASANVGAVFSKDSIKFYSLPNSPSYTLSYIPSVENTSIIFDSINWTRIEGVYSATGIERFITIGNFRNDASTQIAFVKTSTQTNAYYFIDDVSVTEIVNANASIKDTIVSRCVSDSVVLGTDSTWDATYTWQSTSAGLAALSCTNCPNPIAKPLVTTKYYLTKVQCSATTMDSVTVVVLTPTTQADAGNGSIICEGDFVRLGVADSASFVSYSWQGSGGNWQSAINCTYCAQPLVSPIVTTTYTVQRTECTTVTTDTVKIIVDDCDPTFVLPNVFTPNYDGVNDTWGISFSTINSRIKNFKMSIYNRWGLLVYSTNSELSTPNTRWDGHTTSGEECSEGVYYYIVTFEKNEEHVLLKGHLSLFK